MIPDETKFMPYLRDRMILKREEGYYVIIPKNATPPVPLSCPVCDFLFRTSEDERSWHKFKCCERCATFWAIPKRELWESGWRPSGEELRKEVSSRSPIVVDINID